MSAALLVALRLLSLGAGLWLAFRVLDLVWKRARSSPRVRGDSPALAGLLAARRLGKLLLAIGALGVGLFEAGASRVVLVVLGAIGAALAFAAREPIQDVFAFVTILLDPPFRLGDRVRLVDFRGGEDVRGEVIRIAVGSITIRTGARTLVSVPIRVTFLLRVENLSASDRRRLELAVAIPPAMSNRALGAACNAIERDLLASPHVTGRRPVRVWVGHEGDVLAVKAFVWLRRASGRREAQRELLLAMRAQLPSAD